MKVVFDAGVVFSAAGWRGEAYSCLLAMARRRVIAYATDETLKELQDLEQSRGGKIEVFTKGHPSMVLRKSTIG